ncbi:GNAT family N-acetyltransferase [Pararobbsia silviterrae]|uniref:GNAT family N-acetyltransferase n=1 Tax=Pararobbsia silviterrae TaxID=1792498 RepID=A0A494XZL6_9BURK|nr:GNAT family N-acetyltransferase [Pararobbsia silviterrae]RKP55955.1 GNAT family N-acetyltransferase [Pararobbsia silviterrae]
MAHDHREERANAPHGATSGGFRLRASWIVDTEAQAATVRAHALAWRVGLTSVFAIDVARDMDSADMLDFLGSDAHTQIVFLATSRIERPDRFLSAMRATSMRKPVLALGMPPDGAEPAVYYAALARTAVVCLDRFETLLEIAEHAEIEGIRGGTVGELHRTALERMFMTPPLPAPDARGLRDAHARARHAFDDCARTLRETRQWLDPVDARRILDAFGVPTRSENMQSVGARTSIDIAIHDDAVFGAYMTLGSARDVFSTHLLPLDPVDVDTALRRMAGLASVAREILCQAVYVLESLSALVCGEPRVERVTACCVLDVDRAYIDAPRLCLTPHASRRALSIRPYPFEFEETIDWDGIALTFRPIRPEDEGHHAGLFGAQSAEDLYLRFFSMQRKPDHARLARLVRIDYAREMAIIACSGGLTDFVTHGVARAVADPSNESAEFAVAIRSDEKGHHLGRMLMDRIIDYGRRQGIARLVGIVLKENHRMLALAQDCGFERFNDEDPTIWSLVLPLQARTTAWHPESLA